MKRIQVTQEEAESISNRLGEVATELDNLCHRLGFEFGQEHEPILQELQGTIDSINGMTDRLVDFNDEDYLPRTTERLQWKTCPFGTPRLKFLRETS